MSMELTCGKCGHLWTARIDEPLACPKCKRYDWSKTKGDPSPVKDQGEDSINNSNSQGKSGVTSEMLASGSQVRGSRTYNLKATPRPVRRFSEAAE